MKHRIAIWGLYGCECMGTIFLSGKQGLSDRTDCVHSYAVVFSRLRLSAGITPWASI